MLPTEWVPLTRHMPTICWNVLDLQRLHLSGKLVCVCPTPTAFITTDMKSICNNWLNLFYGFTVSNIKLAVDKMD